MFVPELSTIMCFFFTISLTLTFWPIHVIFLDNAGIRPGYLHIKFYKNRPTFNEVIVRYRTVDIHAHGHTHAYRQTPALQKPRFTRLIINCNNMFLSTERELGVRFRLIECFTTTFLHSHRSILAKLGRGGWLMRMRLAWKKSQKTIYRYQKDYIKIIAEARGVRTKDLISNFANIGTADSESGRVVTPWRVLGRVKSIPMRTIYHSTVVCRRFRSKYSSLFGFRIIYNGPSSRPHQVAFYAMHGEGCLLLPRSSAVQKQRILLPLSGAFGGQNKYLLEFHLLYNNHSSLIYFILYLFTQISEDTTSMGTQCFIGPPKGGSHAICYMAFLWVCYML